MSPDPRLVGALLYDGFYAFEFQLAAEVFGLERPEMGPDWYRFTTCAETAEVSAPGSKLRLTVDAGLDALAEAGTIIVPGWPLHAQPSAAIQEALLRAHAGGSRLVSICSGAFLIAELGLLDGRSATTHWRYTETFERRFPQVRFEPGVLYVDEGDIATSAGSAAGLDLLLHLVRKDMGVATANSVARRLVIPPHREGGQRQFVETPVPKIRDAALSELIDAVRDAPSASWTLRSMAARCAMSERTFSRRFVAATGESPGHWLVQERLRAAKEMLETTSATLMDVASVCGLGSPENFARRFRTHVGISPGAYRKQFACGKAGKRTG